MDARRRNGLEPLRAGTQGIPHPEHARRHSRAGRHPHRPWLPHRTLRSRAAHAGGGGRAQEQGRNSLCGLLQRPMRRAHPRHHRDDGQPGLPQRRRASVSETHSLPAHPARRDRSGHLRQRTAGNDDRPGLHARSAVRIGARRRHLTRRGRRRRRSRTKHWRAVLARRAEPGGRFGPRLPGLRIARRRLPVPRHRRDPLRSSARRLGCRCRTPRLRHPDRIFGKTWRGAPLGPSSRWSSAA